MKKILSTRSWLLLFVILFAAACQKQDIEVNDETASAANESRSGNGGGCRLTMYDYYDAVSDYRQVEYFTYKNGLVDEWLTSYGWSYKLEYDSNRRLKKAKVYEAGVLIHTIDFIYKKGNVVKEIWYAGNTSDVFDEVTYTYNQKGQMISGESVANDYKAINTYTHRGDLKSWQIFTGGLPQAKGEYIYRDEFKNPYSSAPGVEYSFPYTNAAFGTGKRWYSSEKITIYDENGNPVILYDQDPLKTVWQGGPQNLPLQADYVDKLSGGAIINAFEYENCPGCKSRDNNTRDESIKGKGRSNNNNANLLSRLSKKELIQKARAMKLKRAMD